MAKYEILISSSAEKNLKKLPSKDLPKILKTIENLSFEPYPVGYKKLTDYENTFRIRIGHYRVIYEIENQKLFILVLKIGHRKDIYR